MESGGHGRRLAEMPADKRSILAAITETSSDAWRHAGANATRMVGDASRALLLPTDGLTRFFVYVKLIS
jgi:hypothetical protein